MPHQIYCAGPLFNPEEQREMAAIATALEQAGFETFLPQRDGFELAKLPDALLAQGVDAIKATDLVNRAIFALDVSQVIDSDGTLVNLNGRVPDEGAMVEIGVAFSHGRPLAMYKADVRTLIDGNDNPLVVGLADFAVHATIGDAVTALAQALKGIEPGAPPRALSPNVTEILARGRTLRAALSENRDDIKAVAQVLMETLDGPSASG